MPRPPDAVCPFCHGTGILEPEFIPVLRGEAGQRCPCTFSAEELLAGLREVCDVLITARGGGL